jgi:hypothetical protein
MKMKEDNEGCGHIIKEAGWQPRLWSRNVVVAEVCLVRARRGRARITTKIPDKELQRWCGIVKSIVQVAIDSVGC